MILLFSGCSNSEITDTKTKEDIVIISELQNDMESFEYELDTMDRGKHDYYSQPLVIHPSPNQEDINRGTVIVEDTTGKKIVSRIIALPGETIKIDKGTIIIDGKKLNTFYGQSHHAGLTKEDYFKKVNEGKIEQEGMEKAFDFSLNELELKDDEYYIIGDDWFRSDKKVINSADIKGVVLGYLE